jgi:hypothetical protein
MHLGYDVEHALGAVVHHIYPDRLRLSLPRTLDELVQRHFGHMLDVTVGGGGACQGGAGAQRELWRDTSFSTASTMKIAAYNRVPRREGKHGDERHGHPKAPPWRGHPLCLGPFSP